MKLNRLKSFMLIIGLIAATGAAMAYTAGAHNTWFSDWVSPATHNPAMDTGPVSLTGRLVQDKILQGSDGRVNLAMTLQASDNDGASVPESRNVDMVIVLDRSGSMQGRKIEDARQAVRMLLSNLSSKDRFALVTYSDSVQHVSPLKKVTENHRDQLETLIHRITASGGTNLGAGLQTAINLLASVSENDNARKVILISDGLANKGITDPNRLGAMAGVAVKKEFAVSTVGVGNNFNELLMTTIADRGAGYYYYLENPVAFAEVFQKELSFSKATVATNVSISFPLSNGISLLNAAGYPIKNQNNHAVFHPGDLRAGQTRKLFLTLQVPSGLIGSYKIGEIKVHYRFNGQLMQTGLDETLKIACVKNKKEVQASIDKASWTEKVLREDYNRLKQEVAGDIKAGKKQKALQRINSYYREQETINRSVASEEVTQNLDRDLKDLRERVEDTFQGAPAAVTAKQKANSKAMQYEGYKGRR